MSELKFKYRIGFCDCCNDIYPCDEYDGQCQTSCAADRGCKQFDDGSKRWIDENGKYCAYLTNGSCIHAKTKYKWSCRTVKSFDCEYIEDDYNPQLNCILLNIHGHSYECEEVYIDGVKVFSDKMEG